MPSLPAKVKSKDDDRQLQIETTLVKMGIDRHDLSTIAPITEILKNADGGIPEVIRALRFSIEPFIEQFFDQYDGATEEDRALLPLEAFILKADIDEAQFIGEAILMLQNTSANIVKIIATTAHPRVMRARVENALKPGGYRDRNAIDTALRFLPQPKGATTFIFPPGTQPQGPASSQSMVNPDDVDAEDLFPDLFRTQKLLKSGE